MTECGRKRWAPKVCPKCGDSAKPPLVEKTFADVLNHYFSGIHVYVQKNAWGLTRWYWYCAGCMLREELLRRDYMLATLKGSDKNWTVTLT